MVTTTLTTLTHLALTTTPLPTPTSNATLGPNTGSHPVQPWLWGIIGAAIGIFILGLMCCCVCSDVSSACSPLHCMACQANYGECLGACDACCEAMCDGCG